MTHTCPVCGYPALAEAPRSRDGGGSYEICPSCGFQFGVSDDDKGQTYEQWREAWKKAGMKWASRGIAPPAGWNPQRQLADVPVGRRAKARRRRLGKAGWDEATAITARGCPSWRRDSAADGAGMNSMETTHDLSSCVAENMTD
jgi:hypothetical protein